MYLDGDVVMKNGREGLPPENLGVRDKVCARSRRPAPSVTIFPRIVPSIKVGVRSEAAVGALKGRSGAHTLAEGQKVKKKEGDRSSVILFFLC